MDPPDSFIYGWHVEEHYHLEIQADCELLQLPPVGYRAQIRADRSSILVPATGKVLFKIGVENRTNQSWDVAKPNYLRLGFLLKTSGGQTIRELAGMVLPLSVASPGGRDTLLVPVDVPDEPGEYMLVLDLVQEWVCWFSDRGSQPLICSVRVD
jgi:hypothetical protein